MQLVGELVLGFLEFFDRLTETARKLGQFFGAEKHEDNEQDDQKIWSAEVHETGEETHWQRATFRPLALTCKVIQVGPLPTDLLPLARVVISRGKRNFFGATFPSFHFNRGHYRGGDFDRRAVDGCAESERRPGGSTSARVARQF